jgi:hypothetical protein
MGRVGGKTPAPMFAASYARRLVPGLSLAVLLLGCSVPEIDYYDATDEEAAVVDTGAPDRKVPGEEDAGVPPGVDGSDVGEAASDALAADATVEADSADAPVGLVDAEWDAAEDPETSDSATRDSAMTGNGTTDSATLDSAKPDAETPDAETFDAPDSADTSPSDAFDATEAQGEASTQDGSEGDADGESPNTCPQEAPPGAATCCAHSPCAESQGNSCQCGKCASMHCAAWCCANSQGGMSCVAGPADCR